MARICKCWITVQNKFSLTLLCQLSSLNIVLWLPASKDLVIFSLCIRLNCIKISVCKKGSWWDPFPLKFSLWYNILTRFHPVMRFARWGLYHECGPSGSLLLHSKQPPSWPLSWVSPKSSIYQKRKGLKILMLDIYYVT